MNDSFLDFYYEGWAMLLFFLQKEEVGNVFAIHLVPANYFHLNVRLET